MRAASKAMGPRLRMSSSEKFVASLMLRLKEIVSAAINSPPRASSMSSPAFVPLTRSCSTLPAIACARAAVTAALRAVTRLTTATTSPVNAPRIVAASVGDMLTLFFN